MHGLTKEQAQARLFDLYNELNATRFNSELPTPLRPLIRVSWEAQGLASFRENC
jgi:hypothetical protein